MLRPASQGGRAGPGAGHHMREARRPKPWRQRAAPLVGREQRLEQGSLFVGKVGGVRAAGAGHGDLQKLGQHAFARNGSPYNARKTHWLPFAKLFLRLGGAPPMMLKGGDKFAERRPPSLFYHRGGGPPTRRPDPVRASSTTAASATPSSTTAWASAWRRASPPACPCSASGRTSNGCQVAPGGPARPQAPHATTTPSSTSSSRSKGWANRVIEMLKTS